MKSFIAWIKGLFSKSVKVQPLPKVNEPVKEVPKVETPKPVDNVKPLPVTDKPGPILGIDVSHHNNDKGPIDFKKVKAAGYDFVYIKASEGDSYKDPFFLKNYKAAKEAGLLVGAYHFMRPVKNWENQFSNFMSIVGGCALDLPFCLDWEASGKITWQEEIKCAQSILDAMEARQKRKPIIYTGAWYFEQFYGKGVAFGMNKYPLWISHYNSKVKSPRLPKPWTTWAIWQTTESGTVPGLPSKCDVNKFPGTLNELKKLGIV